MPTKTAAPNSSRCRRSRGRERDLAAHSNVILRCERSEPRRMRGDGVRSPSFEARKSAHLRMTLCSRHNPALDQNALGAVVPDIHFYDEAAPHHEAVDIAVALERRAVDPFAVQRADRVDHGLAGAGA